MDFDLELLVGGKRSSWQFHGVMVWWRREKGGKNTFFFKKKKKVWGEGVVKVWGKGLREGGREGETLSSLLLEDSEILPNGENAEKEKNKPIIFFPRILAWNVKGLA